jgi:glycerophosphoryl diester phosphodiesterase
MKYIFPVLLLAYLQPAMAQTKVIAHRGFSSAAPENTLAAFEKAIQSGADYFELDVRQTKDDSIIVIHDQSLNRTSVQKGKVSKMTYAELEAVSVGYPDQFDQSYKGEKLPSLREALKLAKSKIKVCIEIKVHSAEEEILRTVRELEMEEEVIIFSFYKDVLKKIRQLDEDIPILYLKSRANKNSIRKAKEMDAQAIGVGGKTKLDKDFLSFAHAQGLEVWRWTVNDEKSMRNLIDLGIDGLITDYPEKALEILH